MKINVHAGHTKQNGNAPGASGIVHESIEDRRIKEEVIRILRERGHTVYDCTSEGDSARNNLYRIVEKCNAHTVDLDVSIHLNCSNGKGHGTETLIYSSGSKAKATAKRIDKNIVKLGYTDRGVKVRSDLYVLHRTNIDPINRDTTVCTYRYSSLTGSCIVSEPRNVLPDFEPLMQTGYFGKSCKNLFESLEAKAYTTQTAYQLDEQGNVGLVKSNVTWDDGVSHDYAYSIRWSGDN